MQRPAPAYNEAQPNFESCHFVSIAAASAPITQPVFCAPKAVRLLSVKVCPASDVAADAVNYWTLTLQSEGGGTTYGTSSNNAAAWDAGVPVAFTLPITDVTENTAVHLVQSVGGGTPADLSAVRFAVTVEWTYI